MIDGLTNVKYVLRKDYKMKNARGLLFAILAAIMLSMFAPSMIPGKDNVVTVEAKKANLSRKNITMRIGTTFKLKVNHKKKKVRWHTTNSRVATVSKGLVRARGIGKCSVWASHGKRKLYCKINVRDFYFSASNTALTLDKNESQTILVNSERASAITVKTNNKYIATATPLTGPARRALVKITGEGTAGKTVITVKEKRTGKKRYIRINVRGSNAFRFENNEDKTGIELTEGKGDYRLWVRCDLKTSPKCSVSGDISCNWGSSWNGRLLPLIIDDDCEGSGTITLTEPASKRQIRVNVTVLPADDDNDDDTDDDTTKDDASTTDSGSTDSSSTDTTTTDTTTTDDTINTDNGSTDTGKTDSSVTDNTTTDNTTTDNTTTDGNSTDTTTTGNTTDSSSTNNDTTDNNTTDSNSTNNTTPGETVQP